MKTIFSDELLYRSSNQVLLNAINRAWPIRNPDDRARIRSAFDQRQLKYRHLLLPDDTLQFGARLVLVEDTLFEAQVPLPPMTSKFYPVVRRLARFLQQHAKTNQLTLATFDYISDQLFLAPGEVKRITSLAELRDDQCLLLLRSNGAYFPKREVGYDENALPNYLVVEKDELYRSLKQVEFYQNDRLEDQLVL